MIKELSGINERRGQQTSNKRIARQLVKTAQMGIRNSPKIGNKYWYKGFGKTKASLEGAYPAKQTGKLSRSLKFRIENSRWFRFGATADYAKYLQWSEDPTKRPRKRERPFLTKAHNANKKHFKKIMSNAVMKEIS